MKSPAFKEAEEALRVAYNMLLYVENDQQQIVCKLCGAQTKNVGDDLADMKHDPDCAFPAVAGAFDALLRVIHKTLSSTL